MEGGIPEAEEEVVVLCCPVCCCPISVLVTSEQGEDETVVGLTEANVVEGDDTHALEAHQGEPVLDGFVVVGDFGVDDFEVLVSHEELEEGARRGDDLVVRAATTFPGGTVNPGGETWADALKDEPASGTFEVVRAGEVLAEVEPSHLIGEEGGVGSEDTEGMFDGEEGEEAPGGAVRDREAFFQDDGGVRR